MSISIFPALQNINMVMDSFIFSFHCNFLNNCIHFNISTYWLVRSSPIYSLLGMNIKDLPQTPPERVKALNLMSQAIPVRLSQILFSSVTTRMCRAMIQSLDLG